MKPAATVTLLFLCLVAILHVLRIIFGVEIIIGGATLAMWPSGFAAVALGSLALWFWREQRR